MTLTYGFFNSVNGDRVYTAEQFSSFLDGIVYDGVYAAVGNKFYVSAYSGMNVTVDPGRAWFDHTWTLNSSRLVMTIPTADTVYDRIDAVVLEINKTNRRNYIKVVKGTASANPVRPTLTKTDNVKQYAFAYIRVPSNATSISQSNITYVVDTSETPLCSALALSGIPSGGRIGQVLAKESSESGAVGWYDADKLPYDKWYLADGISEANVLGAFKFIHQTSEANALRTKNERADLQLTKSSDSITWNSNDGFTISGYKGLHNASIWNSSPLTMIAKVSSVGNAGNSAATILSEMNNNRVLFLNTAYGTQSFLYWGSGTIGFKSSGNGSDTSGMRATSTSMTSGVIGVSWNSSVSIYKDGVVQSYNPISNITVAVPQNAGRLIGMNSSAGSGYTDLSNWSWNSFKIQYAVFYSAILDASQHAQIYRQIISDSAS